MKALGLPEAMITFLHFPRHRRRGPGGRSEFALQFQPAAQTPERRVDEGAAHFSEWRPDRMLSRTPKF